MRMFQDGRAAGNHPADRFDFLVRDRRECVPAFAEHAYDATGLDDFDVAVLVHLVLDEQIPWEERTVRRPPASVSAISHLCLGKEQLEALDDELVADKLFAVTVCPDCIPRCGRVDLRGLRPLSVNGLI